MWLFFFEIEKNLHMYITYNKVFSNIYHKNKKKGELKNS